MKSLLKITVAMALTFCAARVSAQVAARESLSYMMRLPATKSAVTAWGRDPFVPAMRDSARAASAPDLRLTAIFYNAQKPSAIINGGIVYVGSVINGQKIIDIGNTHVILSGISGRIRLEITEAPEHTDGARQKK